MHSMSNGAMARPYDVPPLQFGHRSSGKQSHRRRTELALLVNLHPSTILTELENQIMENHGLDGHWLIVMIAGALPNLGISLVSPPYVFDRQMSSALNQLSDLLFNDMVAGYEADGLDDDILENREEAIVEDMPTILAAAETVLTELCNIMRNYSPPPFCLQNSLLPYLLGYSIRNACTGCLHFHFADHENHRTFRL
jgi:hypothetical protein